MITKHCQLTYWVNSINTAKNIMNISLCSESEFYLIELLQQSIRNVDLANNNQISKCLNLEADFKITADQCLLLSGIFPDRSLYLGAGSLAPLVWAGQQSYLRQYHISELDIYYLLCENFVVYMDLMLAVKVNTSNCMLSAHLISALDAVGSSFPNYVNKF